MKPVLVFDIETIPDVPGLRRINDLPAELSDAEVAELAFQQRRAKSGNDFLPLHLQRVVAISCVLRTLEGFKVWSLAEPDLDEGAIIQRFFDGIEKFTPADRLLERRRLRPASAALPRPAARRVGAALLGHGRGRLRRLARFQVEQLHQSLPHPPPRPDGSAGAVQARANAPLDDLAKLFGFPGKLGMDGSKVWEAWQAGQAADIRDYCETDVVNTWLVYNRFRRMRGELSAGEEQAEQEFIKAQLAKIDAPHWREFLSAWR
jgi:3'-5' exonuclease